MALTAAQSVTLHKGWHQMRQHCSCSSSWRSSHSDCTSKKGTGVVRQSEGLQQRSLNELRHQLGEKGSETHSNMNHAFPLQILNQDPNQNQNQKRNQKLHLTQMQMGVPVRSTSARSTGVRYGSSVRSQSSYEGCKDAAHHDDALQQLASAE